MDFLAYAMGTGGNGGQGGGITAFLPLLIMLLIFYWIFIKKPISQANRIKARKKDATKDMRGGQRWALTFRGLVYLILNGSLEEKELTKAITKLLHALKLDFSKAPEWQLLVVQEIKDAVFKMKPQISFQFFDNEYVSCLFGSLVMEGIKLRSLSNPSLKKIG